MISNAGHSIKPFMVILHTPHFRLASRQWWLYAPNGKVRAQLWEGFNETGMEGFSISLVGAPQLLHDDRTKIHAT